MATVDATKHAFSWTVGGSAAVRRNSLDAEGPLKINEGHFLAKVLAKHLPPPNAAGVVAISMRLTEFVLLECFDRAADFPDHQAWVADVITYGQMVAELDDGSLSWQECSVEQLQERCLARSQKLPPARRRLSLSGLIVFTADADFTDSWWDFVSAKLLVQRDPTNAVLMQFRQACSYAYTVSDRQSDGFTDILDFIATAEGLDQINDVSHAAGAAKVAAWFRRTRQDSGLYMFFDLDECNVEIARRMENVEGRFQPLFAARFRDAYLNISAVLKQPCNGNTAATFATSL